ncbi:hypothetical protein ACP70R_001407 [Stipagrostis hirtigluma subsp. patula]
MGAQDASTQTDDSERDVPEKPIHMAGVSTEDSTSDAEIQECHERSSQVSPKGPQTIRESPQLCSSDSPGGRVETLESLIRAEASRRSSFRTLEEEHMFGPMSGKFKPANLLMQIITCGSISVKDHRGFGFIPTYRPRFTQVEFPSPVFSTPMALRHLDKMPCNAKTIGMRAPESEYFSGSLVEAKKQAESGRGMGTLKRSSSYDEDRVYRASHCKSDTESSVESGSFRCLPQSIKIISCKQSRSGTILSPASDVRNSSCRQEYSTRSSPLGSSKSESNRMTDPSLVELPSGARVIGHVWFPPMSAAPTVGEPKYWRSIPPPTISPTLAWKVNLRRDRTVLAAKDGIEPNAVAACSQRPIFWSGVQRLQSKQAHNPICTFV